MTDVQLQETQNWWRRAKALVAEARSAKAAVGKIVEYCKAAYEITAAMGSVPEYPYSARKTRDSDGQLKLQQAIGYRSDEVAPSGDAKANF